MLAVLPLASLPACEDSQEPDQAAPVIDREIKLVEACDRARLSLPEAGEPEPAAGQKPELVLRATFEPADPAARAGKQSPLARLADRPDGRGRALVVKNGPGRPAALLVPARGGAFYRIGCRSRGAARPDGLQVLEINHPPRHPGRPAHPADLDGVLRDRPIAGSHVRLSRLIATHRLPPPGPGSGWRSRTTVIHTRPDCRGLLVLLGTFPPAAGPEEELWFDDLEIRRLQPGPRKRFELLVDLFGLRPARGPGGLSGFGQFLKLLPVEELAHSQEANYAFRHALVTPAGSRIGFRLRIPPEAVLDFGLGRLRGSLAETPLRGIVRIDGRPLDELLLAPGEPARWHERRVDLGAYAGRTVRLDLQARSPAGPAAVAAWSNPVIWRAAPDRRRPDVFVFAVDTLRADRLSCYGYGRETSPNIDALAADGVLFEHAYAQSNWTPESFASIFTSQYAGQHGVTDALSRLEKNPLAERFRRAGYFAQAVAYKLLLYNLGFENGFDAYFNVPRFDLKPGYSVRAADNWRVAEKRIRAAKHRTKFFFLHFNDPHQPFNQEAGYIAPFTGGLEKSHGLVPPLLITGKTVLHHGGRPCHDCVAKGRFRGWFRRLASDLYDGEVAYLDAVFGRFVALLRELGLYERSLIVFLSDHGEGLADHHDFIGHGEQHLHQEQIRVPLIIKPPTGWLPEGGAGRRVEKPVRNLDILPTVLDIAGLPADSRARGNTLAGLMWGRKEPRPRPVISENAASRAVAVLRGDLKYILHAGGRQIRERLYHLGRDPLERRDLSGRPGHKHDLDDLRRSAASHILKTHPGAHLLVRVKESGGLDRLTLMANLESANLEVRLGRFTRTSRPQKPDRWRLTGWTSGSPVFLARIAPGQEDQNWKLEVQQNGKSRRVIDLGSPDFWKSGDQAVSSRTGGILEVTTARNRDTASTPEAGPALSGDQLEALRSLGYVE